MLYFKVKDADISKLLTFLAKENVCASLTESEIILKKGKITTTLIKEISKHATILTVTNFNSTKISPKETLNVKRGDIYLCDFGIPTGHEQGFMRYAIAVQNDIGNAFSPTTIVVPCTAQKKTMLSTHMSFYFGRENVVNFDSNKLGKKKNTLLAEHIRVVDKSCLKKYLGTLSPDFMKMVDKRVAYALSLASNNENSAVQNDIRFLHLKMLEKVNVSEVFSISNSSLTYEEKLKKILTLFGFDMDQKASIYLLNAIMSSPKNKYFNLSSIVNVVSENLNDEPEEVKNQLTIVLKDNFDFKRAPIVEFIRLINLFTNC